MHPKDADGMANSVDPDQTASSDKTLNKHAENVFLFCFTSTVNSCGHIVAVN